MRSKEFIINCFLAFLVMMFVCLTDFILNWQLLRIELLLFFIGSWILLNQLDLMGHKEK